MKCDKTVKRALCAAVVLFGGGAAVGAEWHWAAEPVSKFWFNDANWAEGVWTAGAGNTAEFGASAQKEVDATGDPAVAGLTVSADGYVLTNGTVTLNGPFNVAADSAVTVRSKLAQTSDEPDERFLKTGTGTLVIAGDGTTNTFKRFSLQGGTVVLDGSTNLVTGNYSATAGFKTMAGVFGGNSKLVITNGAQLVYKPEGGTLGYYVSNPAGEIYVEDGLFDNTTMSEFLHGFTDQLGDVHGNVSKLYVRNKGVFQTNRLRLSKNVSVTDRPPERYAYINVSSGGVLRANNLFVEPRGGNTAYFALAEFDKGTLEFWDKDRDNNFVARMGGELDNATGVWSRVTLRVQEGGLTINNPTRGSTIHAPFCGPGDITFTGAKPVCWFGTNTAHTGSLVLDDDIQFQILNDLNLGAVPAAVTTNLTVRAGRKAKFGFTEDVELHTNRTVYLEKDARLDVGAEEGVRATVHGAIACEEDASNLLQFSGTGETVLDPGDDVTVRIGRLHVFGNLTIASGTYQLMTNTVGAVHEDAAFYVARGDNGTSTFHDKLGHFTMTGGRLVSPPVEPGADLPYMQLSRCAQVFIKGGEIDVRNAREWLNGLGHPARTVIEGTGTLRARYVRVSQNAVRNADGDPRTEIHLKTGGTLELTRFYIDKNYALLCGLIKLDGGTLRARETMSDFLGVETEPQWTNVIVRACAGGARIDTNGKTVQILRPIVSGAARDGGVTKLGAGTLTLRGTNTYNGVTCVEGGTLAFEAAECYPGGDLAFSGPALAAKTAAAPYITAPALAMKPGAVVRVTDADRLDERAFGAKRLLATVTTPFAAVPALEFTDSAGETMRAGGWGLYLTDGGTKLWFGTARATVIILR